MCRSRHQEATELSHATEDLGAYLVSVMGLPVKILACGGVAIAEECSQGLGSHGGEWGAVGRVKRGIETSQGKLGRTLEE